MAPLAGWVGWSERRFFPLPTQPLFPLLLLPLLHYSLHTQPTLSPCLLLNPASRSQFFRLADIFLASGMVPAYTAAAFAKRMARLALTAPPAGGRGAGKGQLCLESMQQHGGAEGHGPVCKQAWGVCARMVVSVNSCGLLQTQHKLQGPLWDRVERCSC